MLEVHCNIITADIGCHGDNRRVVELSNQMASRNTIKVRHDNIHQHEIVLCASVHLVNCFQTIKLRLSQHKEGQDRIEFPTYSTIDSAVESVQELATYSSAGLVIFNKQHLRLSNPARVILHALLPSISDRRCRRRLGSLCWHCIRNVVNVLAEHGIDAIRLTDGIHKVVEFAI